MTQMSCELRGAQHSAKPSASGTFSSYTAPPRRKTTGQKGKWNRASGL